jgi:hypothetical protein
MGPFTGQTPYLGGPTGNYGSIFSRSRSDCGNADWPLRRAPIATVYACLGVVEDWNTASFDDLAGDVVAAFEYLKTRDDIELSLDQSRFQ